MGDDIGRGRRLVVGILGGHLASFTFTVVSVGALETVATACTLVVLWVLLPVGFTIGFLTRRGWTRKVLIVLYSVAALGQAFSVFWRASGVWQFGSVALMISTTLRPVLMFSFYCLSVWLLAKSRSIRAAAYVNDGKRSPDPS